MFSEREYEALKKYHKGDFLEEKDKGIVRQFQSIGWMRTGFTTIRGKCEETASLTPSGKDCFYLERVMRNPVRKVLHYLANSVY